jgi:hypothetical protein
VGFSLRRGLQSPSRCVLQPPPRLKPRLQAKARSTAEFADERGWSGEKCGLVGHHLYGIVAAVALLSCAMLRLAQHTTPPLYTKAQAQQGGDRDDFGRTDSLSCIGSRPLVCSEAALWGLPFRLLPGFAPS